MLQLDQLRLSVQEHLSQLSQNGDRKWIVSDSTISGRGVIATEDIAPGEVIYVDYPLVHGPRAGALAQRGCTVCRKIDQREFIKCSRCALLLCCEECQLSEVHYNDCSVISSWECKVPIDEIDDLAMIRALAPIRALLLQPEQKELLTSMQAHVLPQHGSEVRTLKDLFDLPTEDETFMTLACCVLDANAFQIASPYGKDEMSMRGLYPVAGLMNHACVANTRHGFDRWNNMTVKASKPIRAGEEIVTCYSGLLWGTPARRHHLYKTKHFLCKCARCADPTERGTYLAALKCFSRECRGVLLPTEPLNLASSWSCSECPISVPTKHIGAIQSALGSLLGTMDSEDPLQLETFARERLLKHIPPSNQIYVDVQCRLIWFYGETPDYRWNELSESRLALKESLCRSVLSTARALGAGDAHLRGLLLYHLHAALAERARRLPHLYDELKPEIESTIEEAYRILDGDISAPQDLHLRRKYLGPDCDKSTQERLLILDP